MDSATLDQRIRDKAKAILNQELQKLKSAIYDGTIYGSEKTKLEKNPKRSPEEKIEYFNIGELLDAVIETRYRVSGQHRAQKAVDKFVADFNELSNRVGDLESAVAQ